MPETVPKVRPHIDRDSLEVTWPCPGCGKVNLLYTFSETLNSVKHEIKNVDKVSCTECCRNFEVD
jgi:hypothetical protein